ncbi:MAG: polyketide biosynthesis enoyl-CoA hydratase (plasmid) [Candidatus Entotheonella factor]|uniref:Polyketide biosynthesis enoyl-CoA hydratase n=1 Tax=Entotheonella factor TaxID=1429438 RepID=W4M0T8_ENTF1|nr:MAG: polyketide biosynthesis enoyl-CoA hydratase [Candidatus Entotheonella factor]
MDHDYHTIQFQMDQGIGYLRFARPEANNTINDQLIRECCQALAIHGESLRILVLEGSPEVFCFGADLHNRVWHAHETGSGSPLEDCEVSEDPEALYDLWQQLATGPYVTIAHVQGKANAGGIGFVAACDIVLADEKAVFSLSELLFGLYPACVLPFLVRRIGYQKAHYMTLMTQPIQAAEAHRWGLVDAFHTNSADLLRKHLLRLRRLSKEGIRCYKDYMSSVATFLAASKTQAVQANKAMFSDPENLANLSRFVETGQFPWDTQEN